MVQGSCGASRHARGKEDRQVGCHHAAHGGWRQVEESPEGVVVSAELHHTAQHCKTPGGERGEGGGGRDEGGG